MGSFHGAYLDGDVDYPEGVTNEGGETGSEPCLPTSIDVEDLSEALGESEANISAHDEASAEQETAYLLRSPENARQLMEAIARDKSSRQVIPGTDGTGSLVT